MYDKQLLEKCLWSLRMRRWRWTSAAFCFSSKRGFTPTLIVSSRFSSGETWPGGFIPPEAVRHVPKADLFSSHQRPPALPDRRRAPRRGPSGSLWRITVLLFDGVRKRRSAVGLSWKYARDGKMARADGAAGGPVGIPPPNHCDALKTPLSNCPV